MERALLCYRFCFSGGVSGGERTSLLPFLFFWRSFGWREHFSVTVFAFLEEFWVERALLCYRFCSFGGVSGGEATFLLPFLFFWRIFGRREHFSVTYLAFLEEFRDGRRYLPLLFNRSCSSGGVSGGETTSLLPLLFFWRSFGWREHFSTTVFDSLEEFRAERPLLCYRFCSSGGVLGGDTSSLLPFLILWRNFGRRDLPTSL
ncbi:hypothetical protein [Bacillus sp. CHD6a]|uniref:hypothetical protein n=1 Tax=Bacillus sp. CHD6a TaxID=1643452 RepID=UPI0012E0F4FD|nr:hypothetical protein [Bacillus sp. CHD6a]